MLKKERYRRVISYFESTMPDVSSELAYTTPFQLLVAVVLSAQCTDKRVNMVTPALFSAFPTAESMSESTEEEIFSYIKSVSYPNSKSKHLLGLSKMLMSEYGGEVPDTGVTHPPSRCRQKDRQRDSGSIMEQSRLCRRYSHFPCKPPSGSRER